MSNDTLTKEQKSELENRLADNVSKALTTGTSENPAEMEDGASLRYEFLDDEVSMLTWTEGDLEFYRDIPKIESPSPVAQYNVFTRHGQVGPTRFVREIGVSPVSDPNLERKTVPMKFVSDTKQMSLASQVSNNTQDPAQLLQDDGIANVAKTIEWASFYGDSSLSDTQGQNDGLQFDGLAKLIADGNVIDARGESLSEELLNHAAVLIGKGFGAPTDAYMPIGVQSQFINEYLSRQTQLVQDNSNDVNLGFKVNGFNSARGFIRLHGSTVMELDNILDETVRALPDAPREPKINATISENGNEGRFTDADVANGVRYAVTVNSETAKSAPQKLEEAVQLTDTTQEVELEITVDGMYGARPQFVSVYRHHPESDQYYLIGNVGLSEADGQGVIRFTDDNSLMPGTADVFVGEMSQQVVHLFEFLPMMRWNLARINAAETFSILWYGALALRAPKKWVRIKNVGYQTVKNAHSPY